jgi:hypothetical protein
VYNYEPQARYCVAKVSSYLDRNDVVCLICVEGGMKLMSMICKEGYLLDILMVYRDQKFLKRLVKEATNTDRAEMEVTIPAVSGNYHRKAGASADAVRLYIRAHDLICAEELTKASLKPVEETRLVKAKQSCLNAWMTGNNCSRPQRMKKSFSC